MHPVCPCGISMRLARPIAFSLRPHNMHAAPAPAKQKSHPICRVESSNMDGRDVSQSELLQVPLDQLPEELQGLSINEDGLLVDERSGKVINEMGANRFDVVVSAQRGLLDPPPWRGNTERTPSVILSSLVQFPTKFCFSVVGPNETVFQEDVVKTIARICQVEVESLGVRAVERLKGKFLSLQIDATVRAPELVELVQEELSKDARVKMCY